MSASRSASAPGWHKLFAPLPAEEIPLRGPVAPPEVLARPEGAAVAGWEQLVVELSAGHAGLRVVLVVRDAHGRPLSASDMVLYRSEHKQDGATLVEYRQESVGGSFEADGTFRGTRWQTLSAETADGQEVRREATPSAPSPQDVLALKALVDEVLRRAA